MGIDYSTTVFWGAVTEDLRCFLNSFIYGYDEFTSYWNECYEEPIVQSLQWKDGFKQLNLHGYIHCGGCGYGDNELEYGIGVDICGMNFLGCESVELSIEQLQQYQKEYEEIREDFEMLFGIEIPLQGKLGVCVHRH